MKSPCIGCEHELEDKNTDRCANCRDRLEYNVAVGNLPKEVLSQEEHEDQHQEQLAEIAETQMAVDMADLKAGEPSKKKRGRAQKTIVKAETSRKGIYIRPTEFCSEIMIEEIMQGIQEIANSQLRSLPQQVLWILKEKVEEWNREKREG